MKRAIFILGVLMLGFSQARAELRIGEPAPDFTAAASDGSQITLKSVIGKSPIVLYFYPKDDTPGCTKEACGIRDDFAAFRQLDALVYGISYDTVESHQRFAKKFNLPFVLLSDSDHSIAKRYGASGLFFAKRMTFVIDSSGRIVWINPDVNPAKHSQELLNVLKNLR